MRVKLPADLVARANRAVASSTIAVTGLRFRAHGSFVHMLNTRGEKDSNVVSDAMLTWAPSALMANIQRQPSVKVEWHTGTGKKGVLDEEHLDYGDTMQMDSLPGTRLTGDEFGEETRVVDGVDAPFPEAKFIGHRIGPDLGRVEGFSSTLGNLKAGLAKRVQPLPFTPSKSLMKNIRELGDAFLSKVFTREKIREWREVNPELQGGKSWSAGGFRIAFEEALAEAEPAISHGFQVKSNEILPSKGKAPRPIITSGDKGITMMSLVVSCMEDILFEMFHDASIKHRPKEQAMKEAVKRLSQRDKCDTIEGDGSAWDSCCTPEFRDLTENRYVARVIAVLGSDSEVPESWLKAMLNDMVNKRLKGKATVEDSKKFSQAQSAF